MIISCMYISLQWQVISSNALHFGALRYVTFYNAFYLDALQLGRYLPGLGEPRLAAGCNTRLSGYTVG